MNPKFELGEVCWLHTPDLTVVEIKGRVLEDGNWKYSCIDANGGDERYSVWEGELS